MQNVELGEDGRRVDDGVSILSEYRRDAASINSKRAMLTPITSKELDGRDSLAVSDARYSRKG